MVQIDSTWLASWKLATNGANSTNGVNCDEGANGVNLGGARWWMLHFPMMLSPFSAVKRCMSAEKVIGSPVGYSQGLAFKTKNRETRITTDTEVE